MESFTVILTKRPPSRKVEAVVFITLNYWMEKGFAET